MMAIQDRRAEHLTFVDLRAATDRFPILTRMITYFLLLCSCNCPLWGQQEGGEMRYGELLRAQSTYDPIHRSTPLARRLGMIVFNSLVSFDENNLPIPQLTSLTREELLDLNPINQVAYRFPLRDDVIWHDGTPFSGYDILFTYLAMRNSTSVAHQVEFIADVNVINDYEIEFLLVERSLNVLGQLAFHIVPHHSIVPNRDDIHPDNPNCQIPKKADFVIRPIGTGPYHFDPKMRGVGNEAHLMVTENYFGLWSDESRNRAFIDRIVMRKIPDERALAGAVGFSAVDLAVELPPHLLRTCVEQAKSAGRELWDERYQSLSYYFFALNHQHPFLGGSQNRNVRQAMHYATNRQNWLDNLEGGSGILVSGPFPHDSPFADSRTKPYPYDLAKAKSLLQEAGFNDTDQDGILEKEVAGTLKPFVLTLKQAPASYKNAQICEAFVNDLRQVGIRVETMAIPSEEEWDQQVLAEHQFDVVLHGWSFGINANLFPFFHSTQSVPGGRNFISYSNFAVDTALEIISVELDPTALQKISKDLHRMLHRECPYIFLWTPIRIAVGDIKIRNHIIHPDGFFNYVADWWIDQ